MQATEWQGDERRGIQIHILNYIDERLDSRIGEVKALFVEHTTDEMERYTEILRQIDDSRKASETRHGELIKQLTVNISHQQSIENAFIKDEMGKPDFVGHHYDHFSRKKWADWINGVKDSAVTRVVEYASVAVFAWIGYMVWTGLLAGPTK